MTSPFRRSRAFHSEGGFTLLEMVISILILGIIVAPLASSYILGLGTATATAQSVANSSDAQLLAAYYTGDVAGAKTISSVNGAGGTCVPSGSTLLLQTKQTDLASSSAPYIYITYVASENTSAENDLHLPLGPPVSVYEIDRIVCDASGSPTSTLTLALTVKGIPTVCDPSLACPPPSTAAQVTINVNEYEFGSYAPPTLSGFYTYSITGVRRVTS